MRPWTRFIILAFLATTTLAADGDLQLANLGAFKLESGAVIQNCQTGYRTWGTLNPDRSNAILFTTWFAGTSADLGGFWIGPGKVFDSSKYFVVAADAFGDGVSSSPSNSKEQPGATFPRFTIRDMVRSQHQLLTQELKINHVHAVAGASMGGMQTYEWLVSYPDFMDKAIPIVGTPKQTAHDLLLWNTTLRLVERFGAEAMKAVASIHELEIRTPANIIANTKPDAVGELMDARAAWFAKLNHEDYASQLRAVIAQDIYRGRPAEEVAKSIQARMLVIVALQDQMVNPTPARELARLTKSDLVTLSGDCGHLATWCERDAMTPEIARFLAAK